MKRPRSHPHPVCQAARSNTRTTPRHGTATASTTRAEARIWAVDRILKPKPPTPQAQFASQPVEFGCHSTDSHNQSFNSSLPQAGWPPLIGLWMMRPPPPLPFDTTRRGGGLALLASFMLLLLLFSPPGACFGWAPSPSSLATPAKAAAGSRPGAGARAHRRARAVVMMNERTPQPKKVEAYEWAARDVGAPAVILVRPYLDQVSLRGLPWTDRGDPND